MAADPTSAAFQLRSPVMSTLRTLRHVMPSVATSDGAGVKLRRSTGSQRGLYLDPFLMLDEFYSDDPDVSIAGFPAHPHRGFETARSEEHKSELDSQMRITDAVSCLKQHKGILHSSILK